MQIAGNYNTKKEEKAVVRKWIELSGYRPVCYGLKEYENRDAGDVWVKWHNHTYTLFEVKQESMERINTYHGLDLVSAIACKGKAFDKGIHSALLLNQFLQSLDTENQYFKWGKLVYSYSEAWLFYAKNGNDYAFINVYSYDKIKNDKNFYKKAIDAGCQFAINNKPRDQLSYSDIHQSAVLYVPIEFMEQYKVTSVEDIQHGYDMCEQLKEAAIYAKEKGNELWN